MGKGVGEDCFWFFVGVCYFAFVYSLVSIGTPARSKADVPETGSTMKFIHNRRQDNSACPRDIAQPIDNRLAKKINSHAERKVLTLSSNEDNSEFCRFSMHRASPSHVSRRIEVVDSDGFVKWTPFWSNLAKAQYAWRDSFSVNWGVSFAQEKRKC